MSNNNKEQNKEGAISLLDIFYRTLHYWPWAVLSVVVCLAFGAWYLIKTPPVYTETATVLLKDDGNGNSATPDALVAVGVAKPNVNVDNETAILKSPDLMEEVVKRLDLTMNYYHQGRFRKQVAYGTNNPIKVTIPGADEKANISFDVQIEPDGLYKVTELSLNSDTYGSDYDRSFAAHLGDTVLSPMGRFIIEPSPFYKKGQTYDMSIRKAPLKGTVKGYEGRLGAKKEDPISFIVKLTFNDQSPQRGDAVLNTLIEVYNESWIDDKNQIAVATSNFINERIGILEKELGSVDSDISSYKSSNATPDLGMAASTYFAQSQELSQEMLDLNNQLQMAKYLKDYLKSPANVSTVLPTNTGVANLSLESQISRYNDKLMERNALAAKSSERNPLVVNMDTELADMRASILASVDNSVMALQTRLKGVSGAKGSTTSQLQANPNQAKYLLSAERQQKVKENLYLFLLQKREENELNQAFTAYNTRVLEAPTGSGVPTSPKTNSVLSGCFLVGLLLPFGVVYLTLLANTRVRGRKDVEKLKIPMLGEIPQVGQAKIFKNKAEYYKFKKKSGDHKKDRVPVVKSGERNSVNEAFRVLRTNTQFTRVNKDACEIIAVTSFNPGSGKSFITVNLGVAVALRDNRVLIIDGDMRHASASAYVGTPKEGLSDYLASNVNDAEKLLVSMPGNDNLWVLPVGSIPPNPTELLESPRFAKLIEEMRGKFDYVLIDCPPVEVVADAQLIDQYVDRTIFILRAGLAERAVLPVLDKLYEDKKYKRMAFVLNGTSQHGGKYGKSYSYNRGYGYQYGSKN